MKLPKRITAQWINKQIQATQKAGFQYPTEREFFQQGFDALIINNSLKNGGQIRELNEINAYLTKKYDNPILWTQEQYDARLNSLVEKLGSRITFSGVRADIRQENIMIIQDMNDFMETNYNPYFMSTQEMYDAIKDAGEYAATARATGGDTSAAFYQRLEENIQNIYESHRK